MAVSIDLTDPKTRGALAVPVAMSQPVLQAEKPALIGMTRDEMADALGEIGVPERQRRMRVSQLWHWLYVRGVSDFADMSNVSKDLRGKLADRFTIARPEIVEERISEDGTRKWLFRFPPRGAGRPVEVETVYIPEEDRGTLCISSQVGCTLTCSFCHTGTQRLVRNLTAEEILAQLLIARDRLGDFPERDTPAGGIVPAEGRKVTNIVMMGMGEPLYNFEAVKKALLIASDGEGLSLSKRRITLSTSGVVPEIYRTGEEIGVMLAISLHACNDELRDVLVPINKKYPLDKLMEACRAYPGLSNARRITFEYVMIKGVNDSMADARDLVKLLKGIPAKINLIPFNPWPGTDYECSEWEQIEAFADFLNAAGYASPIRTPRGRDILAACGQLKSESERMRKSERLKLETMMIAGHGAD
ncbi:23S rRNA (adenine(2503)-C(2))-methyltransferase RlmN [Notoacmeibacter sp. MSK16QG-6]|uniref:23S rRNA (adenine(2503)-C(2))-methyltransferase RlmN n=1 Tax=Notoacmeibacter sp. MSK16QG-6 TaxID=2957982 RepID=UPI0020A14AA6|nr:23S rRNA (adenine(2503)-C(2))-methyltransferase RlmN [Notoacmeibacter sp. MSK16QG-6]MCP1199157.1 23S rRNA (adenine(2503)-C(2))-methyltransferase RlmN [Notoacmeibacter sp. MSK16QG-6]